MAIKFYHPLVVCNGAGFVAVGCVAVATQKVEIHHNDEGINGDFYTEF